MKSQWLLAFSANFTAIPCHQSKGRNDSHQVHKQAIDGGERVIRVCRKRGKNDSFSSNANHRPHRNQRRQQSKQKTHAKRQPVVIVMYYSYYTYPCVDLERKLVGYLQLLQYLVCAVMDCSFKCSIALFAF